MPQESLFVFAKIYPKSEFFGNAKAAILNIVEQTRLEAGCLQFELHEDHEQNYLFLYEEWESEIALESHYQQTYTSEVFESYKEWLASPVEVVKMKKCETA
jgi:quinol monooxygenase YgiN